MNTVLRPVGPQPARVYWVRRVVVVGVLVLAVVLLAAALSSLSSLRKGDAPVAAAGDRQAAGDASGEGAAADEPDATEETDDGTGQPDVCAPAALTTTLAADAPAYAAGTTPTFTVTLTNSGDSACTVDAGGSAQSLVITSGADRIWSSADCPVESGERLLLMAPGAQEVVQVAWPRVRSDEQCTPDLPEPRAGTYTALAVLAGAQSAPIVFDLG